MASGHSEQPSITATNGRTSRGTFATGNKLARGYPHARRANRLRAELYRVVDVDQFRRIVRAMCKEAENGDVAAAREIIERLLGKPESVDLASRIEELERQLDEPAADQSAGPRPMPKTA